MMENLPLDKDFTGSIPEVYENYLVPMIFVPYAKDLCKRMKPKDGNKILELAAGTGVVTRELSGLFKEDFAYFATDLNPAMLDKAKEKINDSRIIFRQADALNLPFDNNTFDIVICQFGVMFFPDKVKAYSEIRRVLKDGGTLVFNVWDEIKENEFADVITKEFIKIFPENPPRFLARVPHGYSDIGQINLELRNAGFQKIRSEKVGFRSFAKKPEDAAFAYCQGSPLKTELQDLGDIDGAVKKATNALEEKFGKVNIEGKISALVFTVEK